MTPCPHGALRLRSAPDRVVRIGVDATCWANSRGYGRFARELLRAMVASAPGDEFLCIGDRASLDAFPLEAPNMRRVEVSLSASPTIAAAADGHRRWGEVQTSRYPLRLVFEDVEPRTWV